MIGEILKAEMKKQRRTARFICKETGMTEGNLSVILNDKTSPTSDTVQRIVDALGVPITIPPTNGKGKGA